MRWIGTELRNPPTFDGTSPVGEFLDDLEYEVPEEKRLPALDVVIKGTSARWWATHKEDPTFWEKFSLP